MTLQTHVFRRGSAYYHRIRIPVGLRHLFRCADLTKSLKTTEAHTARRRGAALSYGFAAFFQEITREMHKLSPGDIEELTRAFYARLLREDQAERLNPDLKLDWRRDPRALWHLENMAEPGQTPEQVVAKGRFSAAEIVKDDEDLLDLDHWQTISDNRDFAEMESLVGWLLDGTGIKIEPGTPEHRQLGLNATQALVEAKKVAVARAHGDYGADSAHRLFRGITESYQTTFDPRKRATIREVTQLFMAERHTGHPAYESDYKGTINFFTAYFGEDRPVSTFTRSDLVEFKDALLTLPANYRKKYPKATIREAIERNKKDGHPTMSARTINESHFGRLGAVFGWALANGYTTSNPIKGVKVDVPKTKTKVKPRIPFSAEDLKVLFTSPLFVGCAGDRFAHKPGRYKIRDHRYWLPLLSLFTGGRLSELGQLMVTDVRRDGEIDYIEVEDDPEGEGGFVKRIKAEASKRSVPLHPEIIRLGFLEYVAAQRKKKEIRVFSACARDKRGSFSSFTKWFGRYLTKVEIKTPKTTFHSFRHCFEDELREHVRDEELRRTLGGRAFDNSAAEYGHGFTVNRLAEEIRKIEYAGLDLTHLAPH